MAIQLKNLNSGLGIKIKNVYYRIITASITKQRDDSFSVMIDLAGYATQPMGGEIKELDFKRYHISLETIESIKSDSFLGKCYSWLMSLDEFKESVNA